MHRFHRIGGVDDLLHIVRVFEVGRQGGPLVAPRGDFPVFRHTNPSCEISNFRGSLRPHILGGSDYRGTANFGGSE